MNFHERIGFPLLMHKMNVENLLKIGHPVSESLSIDESFFGLFGDPTDRNVLNELIQFYRECNGLFAFESALLIRPNNTINNVLGLSDWNAENMWKSYYFETSVSRKLCFAEDTFGFQFCTDGHIIEVFNPETGHFEFMCDSLESWAGMIIDNYFYYTGYPLIHEWQTINGAIRPGFRLCPKQFFVLHGEYKIDNLYEIKDVEGMQLRGDLYSQINKIPDGTKIAVKIE
ncbi:MAG: hypothetical protein FWE67_00785 [Planctomycetaceae bacterium]|nr:hypothetical protein [Planctomycetaceae bacterium]